MAGTGVPVPELRAQFRALLARDPVPVAFAPVAAGDRRTHACGAGNLVAIYVVTPAKPSGCPGFDAADIGACAVGDG